MSISQGGTITVEGLAIDGFNLDGAPVVVQTEVRVGDAKAVGVMEKILRGWIQSYEDKFHCTLRIQEPEKDLILEDADINKRVKWLHTVLKEFRKEVLLDTGNTTSRELRSEKTKFQVHDLPYLLEQAKLGCRDISGRLEYVCYNQEPAKTSHQAFVGQRVRVGQQIRKVCFQGRGS